MRETFALQSSAGLVVKPKTTDARAAHAELSATRINTLERR